MAENRITSISAEVLATPVSQARVSAVAAEVLATASSEARVSFFEDVLYWTPRRTRFFGPIEA